MTNKQLLWNIGKVDSNCWFQGDFSLLTTSYKDISEEILFLQGNKNLYFVYRFVHSNKDNSSIGSANAELFSFIQDCSNLTNNKNDSGYMILQIAGQYVLMEFR